MTSLREPGADFPEGGFGMQFFFDLLLQVIEQFAVEEFPNVDFQPVAEFFDGDCARIFAFFHSACCIW